MNSFSAFVIVAVIAIIYVAYNSSRTSKKQPKRGTTAQTLHNHVCPYCGANYGRMAPDRGQCSACLRTFVLDRAPNPNEQAVIQREAADIDFVKSNAFPLSALQQFVADVFLAEEKYLRGTGATKILGVEFAEDHLDLYLYSPEILANPKKNAFNYAALTTAAGRQALTVACFNYVKTRYAKCELGTFSITRT